MTERMSPASRRAMELRAFFAKLRYPLSEACKRIVALEGEIKFLKERLKELT